MALTARYLADKSALARLSRPEVAAVLDPLILEGRMATCGIIELEVLYSAVSHEDLVGTRARRSRAFATVGMTEAHVERAIAVMTELAARGQHRVAGIPDLLIASIAEGAGLTLVHYDEDFERIAQVTGQPTLWVVPRGTVP